MSQLSPAAKAVLEACGTPDVDSPFRLVARGFAAAALRAAADQVVPDVVNAVGDEHDEARRDQWLRIRYKLLAIADELEAQQPNLLLLP